MLWARPETHLGDWATCNAETEGLILKGAPVSVGRGLWPGRGGVPVEAG